MAEERSTFLVVMWDPPQEINGIIIAYEITFASDNTITVMNTTKSSAILTFTTYSNISVRGYTSAGPGPEAFIVNEPPTEPTTPAVNQVGSASSRVDEQLPFISGVIAFTVVVFVVAVFLIVLMLEYFRRYIQFKAV